MIDTQILKNTTSAIIADYFKGLYTRKDLVAIADYFVQLQWSTSDFQTLSDIIASLRLAATIDGRTSKNVRFFIVREIHNNLK